MKNLITKLHLAIALLSLRMPIIGLLIFIYSLLQAVYNYKLGHSLFVPFQIVECVGSEEINTGSSSQIVNETVRQIQNEGITVNHRLENQNEILTAAEIFKQSLKYYAPALTVAGVGWSTTKISGVLPPEARVGAFFGVFGAVSGFTLLTQLINKYNNNSFNTSSNTPSLVSNNANSEELKDTSSPSDFNINSPLEFDSFQEGLSIVMIFFTIGMLYPYISLTINLLVKELDFKNKSFIKNSPRLTRIVLHFEKISRFYRFLMLFLIGINLIGMVITVYFLYNSYI